MATGVYPLTLFIKAVNRATGPLRAVQAEIERITAPARQARNAVAALANAGGVPQMRRAFGEVGSAINNVRQAAETTFRRVAIVAGVGTAAAYLFKRQFIDTASTFENLRVQLEGIEGSAAAARRAMAFIQNLTIKTPFEMEDVARAFRVLRGFGLDPQNGTLAAITDQVSKLGGSGDDLTGIALQLGQAWSKGRLQAQDANILVERGVPVWTMLARAVERVTSGQKVTVAQLRKMSEEGQLGQKAIALLLEQMGRESEGASARMMRTWSGMISNLKDQWTLFKLRVMESGPFERIKQRLSDVLALIDRMAADGRLQAWADRIGAALLRGWVWLEQNGPGIFAASIDGAREVWNWLTRISALVGGWPNLIKLGLATYIAGPLVASVVSLTAAVVNLGIALAGTPLGWVLFAIVGLTFAVRHWYSTLTSFDWGGYWNGVKDTWNAFVDWVTGTFTGNLERAFSGALRIVTGVNALFERATALARALHLPIGGSVSFPLPGDEKSFLKPRAGLDRLRQLTRPASPGAAGAIPVRPIASHEAGTARISIDINGAPRGTRARVDPKSTVPIDLSLGVAMSDAF